MFHNSKRYMGIFFVVLLFSILTVSTANAEENKDTNVEEQNQSVVSSESLSGQDISLLFPIQKKIQPFF